MEQRDLAIPARVLARGLHQGHVDAHGRPVFDAVQSVAQRVAARHGQRHAAVAVAWLRLSIACGGVSERELEVAFGPQIAGAVAELTRVRTSAAAGHEHLAALDRSAPGAELAALVLEELEQEAAPLRRVG